MPIQKPQFQQLNVTQLQAKLDQLAKMVDENKSADGSVDTATLEQSVAAADDPALAAAFERVQHDYRRVVGQRLSADGSSYEPTHAAPDALAAHEVKSVMGALIDAKAALSAADTNQDGRLDRAEVLSARDQIGASQAAGLADAIVLGSRADFEKALSTWLSQSPRAEHEMSTRRALHATVKSAVSRQVQSAEGQAAALWFLRDALVEARIDDRGDAARILDKADDSFWTRLFGGKANHLDDGEIARLVGTADLAGYAAQTAQRLEAKLGQSFLEAWLDGGDLADPSQSRGQGYRFVPPQS